MSKRIIPLNLPAGLDREVVGNPVTTRSESVPANCFPGLDIDVRNLDRRFFPGLVFDFTSFDENDPLVQCRGAQLVEVALDDPDLVNADKALKAQLSTLKSMLANTKVILANAKIMLDRLQAGLNSIDLNERGVPYDWDVTWRLVRSLEAGPLTISLSQFDGKRRVPLITLQGQRRIYQQATGEISVAYRPGELTQSLCSPWQHDFRGCACSYWASNHPDIVLPAHPANVAELGGSGVEERRAEDPIIWMRWDRDKPVAPRATRDGCRPLEMDHYEINQRWRELAFVLEGREQRTPWSVLGFEEARPLDSNDVLPRLEGLAGMELALALEYLYARYTVRYYDRLADEDLEQARFIAHELLNVAISEMMHLRWVNELMVELGKLIRRKPAPVLKPSDLVPKGTWDEKNHTYIMEQRLALERPIDEAIEDFVGAEAPSGTLEGQYAQILSRLKLGWPATGAVHPDTIGLIQRIIGDGVGHYSRFREIQEILQGPRRSRLVKHLKLISAAEHPEQFKRAVKLFRAIIRNLTKAYGRTADRKAARAAADTMVQMDRFAQ